MNKKSLMGIALAAVITLSSTSAIVLASQNTEKATKNVVKVASSNVSENKTGDMGELKASDIEELKTSDKKAIELAKSYLKKYMNVDMDEKMKQDNLRADVGRDKDASKVVYVFFDAVDQDKIGEEFEKNHMIYDDYAVMIYLKDGKVSSIYAADGIKSARKFNVDKQKVKAVAEKFLKDKGLYDGIATMDLIGDSHISKYGSEYGSASINCKDANGNEVYWVQIDLNTYSVIGLTERKEAKSEGLVLNVNAD